MQPLYDLIPVLAFFVTFKLAGMYAATAVLLAATLVQVAVQWLRRRTLSRVLLISASLVLLFGGATLVLHDELFIMWKPTVLYLLFALALIASQVIGKPLLQSLLETQVSAAAHIWRVSNAAWALLFVALAGLNLVFVYRFSRDAWVNWKLATVGLVIGGAVLQAAYLVRHGGEPGGGA